MTPALTGFWRRTAVRFALLLAMFAAGTIGAVRLFERMLLSEVQTVTEAANVAFTRVFVNESWNELRPMLDLEAQVHPRENRRLREVDARVRQFAKGTDMVKVKIYNTKGLTVYSSDPAQLGEDKAANAGFQAAVRGRAASETTYRGKFGAFDGEVYQRNLVSSYTPVRAGQGIEAVAEIYTDRTASIEGVDAKIRKAWLYLGTGMTVSFALVWVLVQAGRQPTAGQTQQAAEAEARAQAEHAEAQARASLMGQAVHALRGDGQRLARALAEHGPRAPDTPAWQALRAPLHAVVGHIDALVLLQDPARAAASPPSPSGSAATLGAAMDTALQDFRGRQADEGVRATGTVASALAEHTPQSLAGMQRLVGMLLDEAALRTGQGQLRLNVQPAGPARMQVEIIGTRDESAQAPTQAAEEASLTLSAAQALAEALNGRIEQASRTARGPWFTVALPLDA